MEKYHRLTREERYQIQALFKSGCGIRQIARNLGRNASSISREIKKNWQNNVPLPYRAAWAMGRALKIRRAIHPPYKITGCFSKRIDELLEQKWSPEQISGRLRLEDIRICHETIYQYVFRNKKLRGELWKNLRRKRRYRYSRMILKRLKTLGKRTNRRWIDQRDKIVEQRLRKGDYERDLMLGKRGGPLLLTIVDRASRFTKIGLLEKVDAVLAHELTVKLLKGQTVHTLTNDNGPEFSMHWLTERILRAKVYFAYPYRSWEKGTNENTNGLLRTYFPKGTDFTAISQEIIKSVESQLNSRPRKCLDFRTPYEVHQQLSRVLR